MSDVDAQVAMGWSGGIDKGRRIRENLQCFGKIR